MKRFTHRFLIFITSFTLSFAAFGQEWRADFKNLIKEGLANSRANPELAIEKVKEAYAIAQKHKNYWMANNAQSHMGYISNLQKDYAAAHTNFTMALEHLSKADTTDYPGEMSIHQNLALIYRKYKSWDQAAYHYEKAEEAAKHYKKKFPKIFSDKGHQKYLVDIPYNRALAYRDQGDYESAGEILIALWESTEAKKDAAGYAKVLIQLGLIQQRGEAYDKAADYFGKVVGSDGVKHSMRAIALHNLGALYLKQEMYDQAQEHFAKALRIKKEHSSKRSQFITYLDMGELAFKTGRIKEAEGYWLIALKTYDKVAGEPELFEVYNRLQLATMEFDLAKAKEYNQIYAQMNKNWVAEQQLQQAQNGIYALQRDIDQIRADREQKQAFAKMLNEYWPLILGGLITVGLLVYFAMKLNSARKKKARLAKVREITQELDL